MYKVPFAPTSPFSGSLDSQPKIIAPVSTLQVVSKSTPQSEFPSENSLTAIPKGSHWVDGVESGTVLLIDQPLEQKCAAIGGIMVSRMKVLGVQGVVVSGRVRDLGELQKTGLPVGRRSVTTAGQDGSHQCKSADSPLPRYGLEEDQLWGQEQKPR